MKWEAVPKGGNHPTGKSWTEFERFVEAGTDEEALAKFAELHDINPTKIAHFINVKEVP